MSNNIIVSLFVLISLYHSCTAIMCHRCVSAMGGCGDDLDWRMFPWRDCGDSEFCVKIIKKVGSEHNIVRDCESSLMRSTNHRLKMPNLRRHGYCLPARKNDASNPMDTEDENVMYCFCNDWNGCNSASGLFSKIPVISLISAFISFTVLKVL
ncbi:uncharacterized protein LOC133187294 [Saccostrea echinata]|uniref:uncharacterized protein LOC133187294 n=1 Tax=Saccostrea echinata TaxID=191078 RepID=UPI002A82D43B|nr:uncharacterized protein LOC133187294 [Saccostrea echinata]